MRLIDTEGEYLQRDGVGVALAGDQLVPGLCALADDVGSVSKYHTSVNTEFRGRDREVLTFCSCTLRRKQTGSRACHLESCRYGTTHWLP